MMHPIKYPSSFHESDKIRSKVHLKHWPSIGLGTITYRMTKRKTTDSASVSLPTRRPLRSEEEQEANDDDRLETSPKNKVKKSRQQSKRKVGRTDEPKASPKNSNNNSSIVADSSSSETDSSSVVSSSEDTPPPKFAQCDRVLARDEDGLLYQAFVRRSLWGIQQHKQIQVAMVTSQQEMQDMMNQEMLPTWHYFVHFLNWKVNWDRWISEDDLMELNEENLQLAKKVNDEHRKLQKEFKKKRKGGGIDGGAFLKAWKKRLDALMGDTNKSKKPSKKKVSKAVLEKEYQLRTDQGLSHRKPAEAQQISLGFGLKKILVEEWELIHQFEMVPSMLPAKITIRQALDRYLESKGVVVNAEQPTETQPSPEKDKEEEDAKDDTMKENQREEAQFQEQSSVELRKAEVTSAEDVSSNPPNATTTSNATTLIVDEETALRNKEWTDMADGLALFFDQSLDLRLLYPSEKTQLAVLEDESEDDVVRKSELYGCEHLLRLFCRLPSILVDAYQRNDDDIDNDDDDDDTLRTILAKLNDFARFLQKNQSIIFCQSYRKKNEAELRFEQKQIKRLERRRKQMLLAQQQQQGAGAEADGEQNQNVVLTES